MTTTATTAPATKAELRRELDRITAERDELRRLLTREKSYSRHLESQVVGWPSRR